MLGLSCCIEHTLEALVCCIVDYNRVRVKKPEHDDLALALNFSKGARS